jgi:hypothetical protein
VSMAAACRFPRCHWIRRPQVSRNGPGATARGAYASLRQWRRAGTRRPDLEAPAAAPGRRALSTGGARGRGATCAGPWVALFGRGATSAGPYVTPRQWRPGTALTRTSGATDRGNSAELRGNAWGNSRPFHVLASARPRYAGGSRSMAGVILRE